MAIIQIKAFITNDNVPHTGPITADIPDITIYGTDSGTPVVADDDMTELAGGFYFYDYDITDYTLDYAFLVDGDPDAGGEVTEAERYQYGEFSGPDELKKLLAKYAGPNGPGIYMSAGGGAGDVSGLNGTTGNPSSDWADAVTLAADLGITVFYILDGAFVLTENLADVLITSIAPAAQPFASAPDFSFAGYTLDRSTIQGLHVSAVEGAGPTDIADLVTFKDCHIEYASDGELNSCRFERCHFKDTGDSADCDFIDCTFDDDVVLANTGTGAPSNSGCRFFGCKGTLEINVGVMAAADLWLLDDFRGRLIVSGDRGAAGADAVKVSGQGLLTNSMSPTALDADGFADALDAADAVVADVAAAAAAATAVTNAETAVTAAETAVTDDIAAAAAAATAVTNAETAVTADIAAAAAAATAVTAAETAVTDDIAAAAAAATAVTNAETAVTADIAAAAAAATAVTAAEGAVTNAETAVTADIAAAAAAATAVTNAETAVTADIAAAAAAATAVTAAETAVTDDIAAAAAAATAVTAAETAVVIADANAARELGLLHDNSVVDNQVFGVNGLTSARLRVFAPAKDLSTVTEGAADDADGEVYRYLITVTYVDVDQPDRYEIVRDL